MSQDIAIEVESFCLQELMVPTMRAGEIKRFRKAEVSRWWLFWWLLAFEFSAFRCDALRVAYAHI
jgi:hypothetical protein